MLIFKHPLILFLSTFLFGVKEITSLAQPQQRMVRFNFSEDPKL